MKDWILSVPRTDGNVEECRRSDTQRLIMSYSESRARKNAWNREKGWTAFGKSMRKAR